MFGSTTSATSTWQMALYGSQSPAMPVSQQTHNQWDFFRNNHRTLECLCNGRMVNGILLCQWHGMSDETRHQYLRHKRLQENYKTQMCRQLMDFGGCPYGERCRFAHDAAELRPKTRHPKYKTILCKNYANNGSCPFGANCQFQHRSPEPVRSSGPLCATRQPSRQPESSFQSGTWSADTSASFSMNFARSCATSTPVRPGVGASAFSKSVGRRVTFAPTPERLHGTDPDGDNKQKGISDGVSMDTYVEALWQETAPPSPSRLFTHSIGARFFRHRQK